MAQFQSTKELLNILSNQSSSPIKPSLVDDASKNLQSGRINTARAEYIINQLKQGEAHPALAAKIQSADKEITAFKAQQKQGLKR